MGTRGKWRADVIRVTVKWYVMVVNHVVKSTGPASNLSSTAYLAV